MTHAGQPKILKLYNMELVEKLISEQGPVTKPELATLTKLSLQTVNKIVDQLADDGKILSGAAHMGSGAGRPARTYVSNPDYGMILTICYENGSWCGKAVNLAGSVLTTQERAADGLSVDNLCAVIDKLIKKARNVLVIGIAIPGVILSDGRITSIPALRDLDGVNLQSVLSTRYGIQVIVENDVKLMTVGYYTKEMQSEQNMVFVYVEDRIGAGLIISGRMYKGAGSFSGELGYMPCQSNDNDEVLYKNGGSMESMLAKARTGNDYDSFYRLLGQTLASCCTVVNPEAVVIYSGKGEKLSKAKIEHEIQRFIPPYGLPEVRVTDNSCYELDGLLNLCKENIRDKCWLTGVVGNKKS